MTMNNDFETVDLLGVGIGPFNMSVAALLSPLEGITSKFFDARQSFVWHAGQLLPDAEIQVSYLKDLVTLVDPTNPYSFLAFLRKQKRLYRFINANFDRVLRTEFSKYLEWVSTSMPNLFFQESVLDVKFKKSLFVMQTSKRIIRSRHLVLGNGLSAFVPACTKIYLGANVFHCKDFLLRGNQWQGKRVTIIGGGQSGAEILATMIADSTNLPARIDWISSRDQFAQMDESVFANEIFTPNYSEFFYGQSPETKAELVKKQTLASDGISPGQLNDIYRRLYVLECLEGHARFVNFIPQHRLTDMSAKFSGYELSIVDEYTDVKKAIDADIVILCTGYRWQMPTYLAGLKDNLSLDKEGHFQVNRDFSIKWDGPAHNRIYAQNAARHSHGVADPNLSLMAWRSATIINSIVGKPVYDLSDESVLLDWQKLSPAQKEGCRYVSRV